ERGAHRSEWQRGWHQHRIARVPAARVARTIAPGGNALTPRGPRTDRATEVHGALGRGREARGGAVAEGDRRREGEIPPLEPADRVAAVVEAVRQRVGDVADAYRVVVVRNEVQRGVGEARTTGVGDMAAVGGGLDVNRVRHHRHRERIDRAHVYLEAA